MSKQKARIQRIADLLWEVYGQITEANWLGMGLTEFDARYSGAFFVAPRARLSEEERHDAERDR